MTRRQATEDITINLTPMIDVVFLLVIFFLVGSKFREAESRIQVDVPTANTMSPMMRGPDEQIVTVDSRGGVFLADQPIALADLANQMRQAVAAYPRLKVTVRGDSNTSLQQVLEVLQTVRTAGVQDFNLANRPVRR
ncbi:MAG: biopolymer transporter ExbD [Planctomycetota bacterium]